MSAESFTVGWTRLFYADNPARQIASLTSLQHGKSFRLRRQKWIFVEPLRKKFVHGGQFFGFVDRQQLDGDSSQQQKL
jgi:hypothetical protein